MSKYVNKELVVSLWCNGKQSLLPYMKINKREARRIKLLGKLEYLKTFDFGFPNSEFLIINVE